MHIFSFDFWQGLDYEGLPSAEVIASFLQGMGEAKQCRKRVEETADRFKLRCLHCGKYIKLGTKRVTHRYQNDLFSHCDLFHEKCESTITANEQLMAVQ